MVAIRRTHGPESRCRAERYVRRGANPTTGDEPVVSQRGGRSTGWSASKDCPGVPSSASSSPLEESSRRAHQNESRQQARVARHVGTRFEEHFVVAQVYHAKQHAAPYPRTPGAEQRVQRVEKAAAIYELLNQRGIDTRAQLTPPPRLPPSAKQAGVSEHARGCQRKQISLQQLGVKPDEYPMSAS